MFSAEPESLQATRAALKPNDKAHYELDAILSKTDSVSKTESVSTLTVRLKYLKGAGSDKHKDAIAEAIHAQTGGDVADIKRWLNRYIARNQSDFFIHKRLKEALAEDLDIFIKTEVLNADQLLADGDLPQRLIKTARLVRQIGLAIIDFLAALEDFQKALWEKKKLVFATRYVITLDRIERLAGVAWLEARLNTIVSAQREEWQALGLGDYPNAAAVQRVGQTDLLSEGPRFLPLPVDTGRFDEAFKWDLLEAVTRDNGLDEMLDGVAIHSDNWQALNTLQGKYRSEITCIYADPPYNSDAGPITYKNGYRHASWVALLDDRLQIAKRFLKNEGVFCITIDDYESHRLRNLSEIALSEYSLLGIAPIKNNPAGRTGTTGFSICHEYAYFYGMSVAQIDRLEHSEIQKARYKEKDENGFFEWTNFRKHGGLNTYKTTRPRQFYPIYVQGSSIRIPNMTWDNQSREYIIHDDPNKNEKILWPVDEKGNERIWDYVVDTARKNIEGFIVRNDSKGETAIYRKWRINEYGLLPQTWWDKKEYSAAEYGTNLLTRLFGSTHTFMFPKSLHAVVDCLKVGGLRSETSGFAMDFFAGSGTTAHAVIHLNNQDGGNRKFILIEANNYLDAVTIPRIKKTAASLEWFDGKARELDGPGLFLRVQTLEQYEDTLENLGMDSDAGQQEFSFDDPAFQLRYRLNRETRKLYAGIDRFTAPFGYQLKRVEGGEAPARDVDLVESLVYLLGLEVERLYRETAGVVLTGRNRRGQSVLVLFRDVGALSKRDLSADARQAVAVGNRSHEESAAWLQAKLAEDPAEKRYTNDPASLTFEGCDKFEAIEAVFALQFGRE